MVDKPNAQKPTSFDTVAGNSANETEPGVSVTYTCDAGAKLSSDETATSFTVLCDASTNDWNYGSEECVTEKVCSIPTISASMEKNAGIPVPIVNDQTLS